jgi:hypothetical protein
MFAIGIREVRNALDEKADEIQRNFVTTSRELREVGRKIMEARGAELEELKKAQEELREKQQHFADEVNEWREKARNIQRHRTEESLKAYLNELLPNAEGRLKATIERSLVLMDATAEQFEALMADENRPSEQTPAGRLLERARISYDLRGSDPGERLRAAVEFANRTGMALNDEMLAEIEEAIDDPDPLVQDVAILTSIQLHRFRAMRVADLDVAHSSVKRLSAIKHPSVIPVLIEILENPRTGFITQGKEPVETPNVRSRMVALLRLVKWHTNEAKNAIQKRKFDPEHEIVAAAKRALELFPDQWTGMLKKSKP